MPFWPIDSTLNLSLQHSLSTLPTTVPCWKWRRCIIFLSPTKTWKFGSNNDNSWWWVPMSYGPCPIRSTPYLYGILGWFGDLRKGEQRGTQKVGFIYTLPKYFLFKIRLFSRTPPPIFKEYIWNKGCTSQKYYSDRYWSCYSLRWDNLPSGHQRYPLLGLNLGHMYWGKKNSSE